MSSPSAKNTCAKSKILCELLQHRENAPLLRQGCACLAPGSAHRTHRIACPRRRHASPIRSNLSFRYTQAGFPPPISPEAGPVPAHKGLWPDDRDGLEDRWKPSIQHDQEQAIPIREPDATAHPPLQHNQLMTECRVLCLKSALRLERRGEQGQEEPEQRDHRR
jgi:hypothetical protein